MSGAANTNLLLAVILLSVSVAASSTSAFLSAWRQRNPQRCLDLVVEKPAEIECAPPYHLERATDGAFTCGCVRIIPRR